MMPFKEIINKLPTPLIMGMEQYWAIRVWFENHTDVANTEIEVTAHSGRSDNIPYSFQIENLCFRQQTRAQARKTAKVTTDKQGWFTLVFDQTVDLRGVSVNISFQSQEGTQTGIVTTKQQPGGMDQRTFCSSTAIVHPETKDWLYNECLANDPNYAKPDSEKYFILWEARGQNIEITACEGLKTTHRWLWDLFIIQEKANEGEEAQVRFPWNAGDSEKTASINPDAFLTGVETRASDQNSYLIMRRWSTASRSCFALVPKTLPNPVELKGNDWIADSRRGNNKNMREWDKNSEIYKYNRFVSTVGPKLEQFCDRSGRNYLEDTSPSRLYSIKTGVSFVGGVNERDHGKNLLEENSTVAITRSNVMLKLLDDDDSFRTQVELLTVTADCVVQLDSKSSKGTKVRDGFQVRDLSRSIRANEYYLPGLSIPYSGTAFSNFNQPEQDVTFWTNNFAVPCGRAKAKMFLKYGLLHMSANAQNFVMAFDAENQLKGFIIRDIGDTSWHENYIGTILGEDHPAYLNGVLVEKANQKIKKAYHLLHETSNSAYPAPHLIRLAAQVLISHGFAEAAKSKRGWTDAHVLRFNQGILDGFKAYIIEALNMPDYPKEPVVQGCEMKDIIGLDIHDKKGLGYIFKYPTPKDRSDYNNSIGPELIEKYKNLLELASYIRLNSQKWLSVSNTWALGALDRLINAEEMALCAYVEDYIFKNIGNVKERVKTLPRLLG